MPEDNVVQQEVLDSLDASFAQTEGEDFGARSGGAEWPKGKYGFKITNTYLNRSSNTNRKQLVAVCQCLESDVAPESVGAIYYKTWGLESEQNFEWLNGDLISLGFEPVGRSTVKEDINRVLAELNGIGLEMSLVPNKDAQYPSNAFINKGARRTDLDGAEVPEGSTTF